MLHEGVVKLAWEDEDGGWIFVGRRSSKRGIVHGEVGVWVVKVRKVVVVVVVG